ncbi:hypothetical protein NM688_g1048 [Phlebia brevispora]|uniref:Uncharacterized protein n=1 Tax=Phlebia brevispora TaxID=194682 RepID=A0ACC1TCZ5_9APHY|nr:hypothetical protein NM688_g1048 [Phlebia brevispora]
MTGYLAFPPSTGNGSASFTTQRIPFSEIQEPQVGAHNYVSREGENIEKEKKQHEEEQARKRVEREEKRRRRLEHERHQVWLSELEWVRSGGLLRDARGRRDMVRTETMRAEIRLQEEEKRILELWNTYETRWRALQAAALSGNTSVSWKEIPWPVHGTPLSPADLTPDAIANFLFAPFGVRGSTGSKKDRIRTFFLRWHPDKFPSSVLSQMADDERDMVVDGVNSVFMALKLIQDVEKRNS